MDNSGAGNVSIEIILYPKAASRDDIADLLKDLGYRLCEHLWDWPEGSLNFHWFESDDFLSYTGVEATVYRPSSDEHELGACEWALHTRTNISASPVDKDHQDETIRPARGKFGGDFYNDWYGKNSYTCCESDGRDAVARGIYLAYTDISQNISAIQYGTPQPTEGLENLAGTNLAALAEIDPMRVLYNALVPFAVASLEGFFSRCFKILLRYEPEAEEKSSNRPRKSN